MLVSRASLATAGWVTVLLWFCPQLVAALPHNVTSSGLSTQADVFYLRILPLGASITYGQGSTHGNGYCKYLRDKLRVEGWNVNMVGSRRAGTMKDSVCYILPSSSRLQCR